MGLCLQTQKQPPIDSHYSDDWWTEDRLQCLFSGYCRKYAGNTEIPVDILNVLNKFYEVLSGTNVMVIKMFQFTHQLARGALCRVVEANQIRDPENKVAIKIFPKMREVSECRFKHELSILELIHYEHIVPYICAGEDEENYYIVNGLCTGGELFDRIVDPNYSITEKIAASLVRTMLITIQYLHSQNIVHRHLIPEHFLFENNEKDSKLLLTGFNVAKVVVDEMEYKDLVGTLYYLAPELAAPKSRIPLTGKVLKSSDIWAIGIIAFIMLTGRPPFKGKTINEIQNNIVKQKMTFPTDIKLSDEFKDFVSKMLIKNPYKRMNVNEALDHSWVLSGN